MAIVSYANGKVRVVKNLDYVLRNAKDVFRFDLTPHMFHSNFYHLTVKFIDNRTFGMPWQSIEAFIALINRPKFHNKWLRIDDYEGTVQGWLYLRTQMEQKKK